MIVHQIFTDSPLRNFNYVIEGNQKHCYIIDPFDGDEILDFVHKRSGIVRAIINTHEHHDHICGNEVIVKKTACPVYAHPNAKGKNPSATSFLEDNEEILIDNETKLKVLDTPGHTLAHLCFILEHQERPVGVFTGDTLFNAGIGHCRKGGNIAAYYETMENKFKRLGDDVIVYPGHEYLENNLNFTLSIEKDNDNAREMLAMSKKIDWKVKTYQNTMGQERKVNLFLRLGNESVKSSLGGESWSEFEVFKELRSKRDNW